MVAVGRDWLLFFSFSAVILALVCVQSDGQSLALAALKALFGLAVLSLVIHLITTKILPAVGFFKEAKSAPSQSGGVLSSEELRDRQTRAREKIQEHHANKAAEYNEKIAKPREAAKQAQKEEEFQRFAGPAWKGEGKKLGVGEHEEANPGTTRGSSSSQDAAQLRRLPDHIEHPPPPPPQQPKPKKKVIVLPEEPPEGSSGCLTVALRTPIRTHKRRFLCTDKIQVLLDFMTKVGYHQKLYTISTSYPRKCLSEDADRSLEDMGITRDVTLNVEAKELEEDS